MNMHPAAWDELKQTSFFPKWTGVRPVSRSWKENKHKGVKFLAMCTQTSSEYIP